MQLKTLFVFNNCDWTTIPQKIEEVKKFFSPKIDMQIDVKKTSFINIPFVSVNALDGTSHQDGVDVTGKSETIEDAWYNKNLSIPNKGYDIIVFCISESDKTGHLTATGIRSDRDQGAVETIVFGGQENWRTYVNGIDIGNNFVIFSCHEISHAIYMLLGGVDNTHKYFYSGQPAKVLEDFNTQPKTVDTLSIQEIIKNLLIKVGLLQQQLADLNAPKTDKLDLFCKAIQEHEGYFPPSSKYPKGSVSYRNNNPFNLRYVGQTKTIGKDANNFAIFKTYADGFETGKQMVLNAIKGLSKIYKPTDTIFQFFSKYAPSFENNVLAYAQSVATKVGVTIDFPISGLVK
jgi:hypothetical protein